MGIKIKILILTIISIYGCSGQTDNHSTTSADKNKIVAITYKIILKTYNPEPTGDNDSLELPGSIDTTTIKNLSEPLKGLASFYSAMGGSYCDNHSCDLTTTLGLGKQGSDKHKNFIKKYLPNDTVADFLIKQDCYLRPDGASSFNAYEYLTFIVSGDTVKADYNLWTYSHGDSKLNKELDIYLFRDNIFKKIKRNDNWIQ
jgi:hypothetical protein